MVIPPYLQKGDKVAVIAPAKKFSKSEMMQGLLTLKSWGLEVITGKNLYASCNQFAGNDMERASDLQSALDDPSIKAVFCARGGYGTARIIDRIDFSHFVKCPKWVIGFSDITVLLCQINNLGIEAIHGPMPIQFSKEEYHHSIYNLKNILFGEHYNVFCTSHALNRDGQTKGKLVGGNLTILHTLISTSTWISLKDKILFIEEIDEYFYHIDRMMVHFKRAGVLKDLKGLVVGHFTDMKDSDISFGKNAYEIILESVKDYDYPVIFGFPAGHQSPNMPVFFGRTVELSVSTNHVNINFESGFLT